MRLMQIEHVQLAMPPGEEAAARSFYAGVLGMTEVSKPESLAKRGGCWFESGATRVHLGVQKDFRASTKAHPAFLVDDLDGARVHLQAVGVACVDDEPLDGFDRTYVFDPFGNRIELMERATER